MTIHHDGLRIYLHRIILAPILLSALAGLVVGMFAETNLPDRLECDPTTQVCLIPPYSSEPVASQPLKQRHPLPCIRKYEGTYSDHSGRYVGAYQFQRSTHASVSNARQERLWPRLPNAEQDRAAWRLYERRGLSRWSNKVRRYCR